jgi:RNA polymerase subunit RPABC4/transcription elongation factor Spt4
MNRTVKKVCPHCGLEPNNFPTNFSKSIIILLNSFNEIAKNEIERVRYGINTNRKELKFRQDLFYRFLIRIKDIPEDIIIDSISTFMDKDYHLTKEYSYLLAIMKNNIIIRDRQIDVETMKYGRAPELQELR